jgi:hypothetical protein
MFKAFQTIAKLHLIASGGETEWCLKKTRIGKKVKTKNGRKRNGSLSER